MDWVSFDEIKKTVTLQMAIEHYGIPLRRTNANTLRGKCPLPAHGSEKSNESFTATLTKGVGGAWACQSQLVHQSRVAASAATSSISSPRWNSVPSAMRRSNCNSGFWFRPRANRPDRLARNLTRKFPRARNRSDNFQFQKKQWSGGE